MDFWTYVVATLLVWAVVLCIIGFVSDRKKGLAVSFHQRTVMVICDRCPTKKAVTVTSPTSRRPSESRWDLLVVQRLHELGWSAGVEPATYGRRIPPDLCPDCRTKVRR